MIIAESSRVRPTRIAAARAAIRGANRWPARARSTMARMKTTYRIAPVT
jgi:hypothetical protein